MEGSEPKIKTRKSEPIKLVIPKFTGRFTGLSGLIHDLSPNKTDKYINNYT